MNKKWPLSLFCLIVISLVCTNALAQESPQKDPPFKHLESTEAVKAFKKGDFKKALEEFQKLSSQYPEYPFLKRYIGMSQTALGQYSEAIESYQQALNQDPNNAATHYYLARVYYAKGDINNAEKELKDALHLDPDGFYGEASKEAIPWVLSQKAVVKPKRWSVYGSLGYEYDSNVILKPNDKGIVIPLDQNANRFYISAGGNYKWYESPKFSSWAQYNFYKSLHDDSLDEFNFTYNEFSIANEYTTDIKGRRTKIGLNYGIPFGFLGGNTFSFGSQITAYVNSRLTKNTLSEVFHRYTHYNFGPDGFAPDLLSRDGEYNQTGITHTWYFSNFRRHVFAGYYFDVASTDGDNYDNVGHSFRVGFRTPLCDQLPVLKNLILDVIADFTVANFYHYSAEVFPPESLARLDNNWGLTVSLTYPLNRFMSLQGYYRYINANNRNDIFQHDRHIGGTALLFTY